MYLKIKFTSGNTILLFSNIIIVFLFIIRGKVVIIRPKLEHNIFFNSRIKLYFLHIYNVNNFPYR